MNTRKLLHKTTHHPLPDRAQQIVLEYLYPDSNETQKQPEQKLEHFKKTKSLKKLTLFGAHQGKKIGGGGGKILGQVIGGTTGAVIGLSAGAVVGGVMVAAQGYDVGDECASNLCQEYEIELYPRYKMTQKTSDFWGVVAPCCGAILGFPPGVITGTVCGGYQGANIGADIGGKSLEVAGGGLGLMTGGILGSVATIPAALYTIPADIAKSVSDANTKRKQNKKDSQLAGFFLDLNSLQRQKIGDSPHEDKPKLSLR